MDLDEVRAVAFDAYQYAYPLVTMDLTRQQATNVVDAMSVPGRAPLNQFAHHRSYPAGDSRDVVRFNFDTLYSFAWLDVTAEPIVLTVPDSAGRYYLTPMLDMWSDVFAVPGTRTTGGTAASFVLTAPGWSGDVPEGLEILSCPTPVVWVMGRTQSNGPDDFDRVHAIQDQYRLTPLSEWGRDDSAPVDGTIDPAIDDVTAPLDQVNAMTGVELLSRFADLLALHPPHAHDHPILMRMRTIGLRVGESFDADGLDAAVSAAINEAAADALQDMIAATVDGSLGRSKNNWIWIEGGTYGTDYRLRAMVALGGLGCNLREDALYPGVAMDGDGQILTGERRYVLRFEPDRMPPANAFWSLTMYDEQGFQVPNALNRFAIGDRDELQVQADGAIELYLQHDNPGPDRESNWLPAPTGEFQPMLRIYSPRPDAIRHGLTLPVITRTP